MSPDSQDGRQMSCTALCPVPDIKFEPWSDWIDFGRPNSEKNLLKALTMDLVLIFLRGVASGNRVEAHMIVNRY